MIPVEPDVLRGNELQEWIESVAFNDQVGVLAVLKAALDASGSHMNAPVLCVAACVATSTQWTLAVDKWGALTRPIVPIGRTYHALRAPAELNEKLAEVLVRHMDKMIAVTISPEEYRKIVPHKFRSMYGGTYAAALQMCFMFLSEWSRRSKDGQRIAYVLEAGDKGQDHIKQLFDGVMHSPKTKTRFCMLSYSFVSKDEVIIQAADLVSHEAASCFGQDQSSVLQILRPRLDMFHMDADTLTQAIAEDQRIRKHSDFGFLDL
jgi:hypothetical protein